MHLFDPVGANSRGNPSCRRCRGHQSASSDQRKTAQQRSTLIAAAAFTGACRGELRGMYWENYKDGELLIARSIWNGITTDPKSKLIQRAKRARLLFQSSAGWLRSLQNIASVKGIRQLVRSSQTAHATQPIRTACCAVGDRCISRNETIDGSAHLIDRETVWSKVLNGQLRQAAGRTNGGIGEHETVSRLTRRLTLTPDSWQHLQKCLLFKNASIALRSLSASISSCKPIRGFSLPRPKQFGHSAKP